MFRSRLCLFMTLSCLCWTSVASARIWTDKLGNKIEADFVRQEADQVVLLIDGQEQTFPIKIFSPTDQRYIVKQKDKPKTETPSEDPSEEPGTTRPSPNTPRNPANPMPENPEPADVPDVNLDLGPNLQMRTWTDFRGQSVNARLYQAKGNVITLELTSGQFNRYRFQDFSQADRNFLMSLAQGSNNPVENNLENVTPVSTFPNTTVSPENVPGNIDPKPVANETKSSSTKKPLKTRKVGGPLQAGLNTVVRTSSGSPPLALPTTTSTLPTSGSGSTMLGLMIVLVLVGALAGASRFSKS